MITFRYLTEFEPPAPFVSVTVGHPAAERATNLIPARVDSAADRTVIPLSVAEGLQLEPVDERQFEGVGGHVEPMPIYLVSMTIRGFGPHPLAVAAHRAEPVILLGRDVLNHYRIVLDGPNQTLEIG